MNDHLSALRLFVRVAKKGSFSAAGRELNVPQPTVSRVIALLEREIGASLLVRTTRAVTLTEAGNEFLSRIEPILAALEEAEHAARGTGELRGALRVGVSSNFARRELVPRLPNFIDRHPGLRVELLISDHHQDLVTEGLDVALRFGPLIDSSAVARKLFETTRVLAAAPAYIERHGEPKAPADLPQHSIIIGPTTRSSVLALRCNGRTASVRVSGRVSVSAHDSAIAAAVAGLGIVTLMGSCRAKFLGGPLVRVLPAWDLGTVEAFAIYPNGNAITPAARAFTSFLAEDFRATPP